MTDKHLSTQFDAELSNISTRILEMGGVVEQQVAQAMKALTHLDTDLAEEVLRIEREVNRIELEIDRELTHIIARRQPTARDLRLLIAGSKTIANLERIGDEAARIARTVPKLINSGQAARLRMALQGMAHESELAISQLRQALDALARLDVDSALQVLRSDDAIDREFDGLMRKLVTYMIEDPRTISASIDLVFVAKALERIGDHAKNLSEVIIYVVKGTDIRHASADEIDQITR